MSDGGPHPLAPLTAAEIADAVAIAGVSQTTRVISVELREPDKDDYLAWRERGGPMPAREAFLVLHDRATRRAAEVVVSLDDRRLVGRDDLAPGVHTGIHVDEFVECTAAAQADPQFRAAVARRGISDPTMVQTDAWSVGLFEDPDRRLVRGLSWLRLDTDGDNVFSRPLYGLTTVVDLDTMEVVRVDDLAPGTPVPSGDGGDYRDAAGGQYRADLRPLEIVQPNGPSFTLDGHVLTWQKWELVVGFHPREGLVLHDIRYRDGDRLRPICHRASVAELVIPYGDPNPTVHFKNVFDIGEYGLGALTNALHLGCDCLGEIRYLDVVANDSAGAPLPIRNGICVHEEDAGLLWKHFDDRSNRTDLARNRRLVISSIYTVGNYEYAFYWHFKQDGEIAFEAKLTGVMHTAGWVADEPTPFALEVADGVVSSNHQHFFCMRLDLDVDGTANVPVEVEAVCLPWGGVNPEGTAFRAERTVLERESRARRSPDQGRARRWRVEAASARNRIGLPVAYELVPGDTVDPMQQPDSQMRERARFLDHALWVTPYARDERYPAGEYPNQHAGGDGLPRWTKADRPLVGEDVVVWYVFGTHHFPRLEDWPVMPVVTAGFHLRPVGFFDRNPALDVPPPRHC